MTRAFALSDGGGAAALGRALRELVAALPSEASTEFDSLIEACDTLRFAPTAEGQAGGSMVPADLQDRARRLIDDLKKRENDSEEDS